MDDNEKNLNSGAGGEELSQNQLPDENTQVNQVPQDVQEVVKVDDLPDELLDVIDNIDDSEFETENAENQEDDLQVEDANIGEVVEDNSFIKKLETKLPFITIITLLVLFLGISLMVIYADTMNIPVISKAMSKIKRNNSTTAETDTTLTANNGDDDEISSILAENSEEVSIERKQEEVKKEEVANEMDNDLVELASIKKHSAAAGRLDPFNPSNSSDEIFDVMAPPTSTMPDYEAQALMTLKISGIMYTPDSPSAIINIAGSDQLVRRGDNLNGFKIERITRDKVTVRNGSNVYTASVGEYLNLRAMGVNAMPNLNKKFAGPYSKGERIIEINTIN